MKCLLLVFLFGPAVLYSCGKVDYKPGFQMRFHEKGRFHNPGIRQLKLYKVEWEERYMTDEAGELFHIAVGSEAVSMTKALWERVRDHDFVLRDYPEGFRMVSAFTVEVELDSGEVILVPVRVRSDGANYYYQVFGDSVTDSLTTVSRLPMEFQAIVERRLLTLER